MKFLNALFVAIVLVALAGMGAFFLAIISAMLNDDGASTEFPSYGPIGLGVFFFGVLLLAAITVVQRLRP